MIARPRWWVVVLSAVSVLALVGTFGWLFRDGNPFGEDDPEVVTASPPPLQDTQSQGAIPPAEQPGPTLVTLAAQALAHPDGEPVRRLLQQHFDAITVGDFDSWIGTVTEEQAAGTDRAVWQRQYRSTRDGSIRVQHIQPELGGGLRVLIAFTSVQDPMDAPADAPFRCLRWWVSYPVVFESGALRIAPSDPDNSQHAAC